MPGTGHAALPAGKFPDVRSAVPTLPDDDSCSRKKNKRGHCFPLRAALLKAKEVIEKGDVFLVSVHQREHVNAFEVNKAFTLLETKR